MFRKYEINVTLKFHKEFAAIRNISFEKVVELNILVELLVTQSNMYGQQRNITNDEEMKSLIGITYKRSVDTSSTVSGFRPWYFCRKQKHKKRN